jgi:beta-glucosidase
MKMITIFFVAVMMWSSVFPENKSLRNQPDYLNPHLSVDIRVKDLLSRMTLEEKARQMDMYSTAQVLLDGEFSEGKIQQVIGESGLGAIQGSYSSTEIINKIQQYARENTRLGIPVLCIDEGLHGFIRPNSTVFPQAIALASTWNKQLAKDEGKAIAAEMRAGGVHMCLAPVLGLARDPRWGRTEETYGEDTYLASRLALYMVSGMQGESLNTNHTVVSEPKHFAAHSIPQGGINQAVTHLGERELRNVFLPVFKAALVEGGAMSVMAAYSEIDGVPCIANKWLLTDLLRHEWEFKGFVLSDLGAIQQLETQHHTAGSPKEAIRQAVEAGEDMQFYDYPSEVFQNSIVELVKEGKLSKETVDRAAGRILSVKFMLGLFENSYTHPDLARKVTRSKEHLDVALQVAQEGICLLKNEDDLLPLKKNLKSIAVIGPSTDVARLGDYTSSGDNAITVLDGIKSRVSEETKIFHAQGTSLLGDDLELKTIPSDFLTPTDRDGHGLKAEYFNNMNLEGEPVLTRIDKEIDFKWFDAPDSSINPDYFSIQWSGILISELTVNGRIGTVNEDGARLWIDGQLIIDDWRNHAERINSVDFTFKAGKEYDIRFEYYENQAGARAKLGWKIDFDQKRRDILALVDKVKDSDVIIFVGGGSSSETCGEGVDRMELGLPGDQLEIVKILHETGVPIVLVLQNGRPFSINWIDENIPAILEAWYPGEQGGNAIADVIFGDYNPAGRLPVTFPKSVGQLPLFYNHKPSVDGIYLEMNSDPLYPFGFGLSYTKFEYGNLMIMPEKTETYYFYNVSVDVRNTGSRDGDEVVQLYINDLVSSVTTPIKELRYINDLVSSVTTPVKELRGFERIHLKSGEQKTITFTLKSEDLEILDGDFNRVVEPGKFEVMVGGNSVEGIKGIFEVQNY